MEERVTTSFIPKMSLRSPETRSVGGNPVALANLVTGALLVLSIAGAGGMYAFQSFTNAQIAAKQASLARARGAFEPATIQELSRLDKRLQTGENLLKGHLAVSKLFDELEKLTLSSVRYSDFSYSVVAPGHVALTMSGEAASFNAVALQADSFAKSSLITDPIFSNVNVGKLGTITFDFTGIIDLSRMLYTPGGFATTSAPQSGSAPASAPGAARPGTSQP